MSDLLDRSDKDTTGADDVRPPTDPISDEEMGEPRHIPWRKIFWSIIGLLLVGALLFATYAVTSYMGDQELKNERKANAMRDLNNRAQDKEVPGTFTEVFFVGNDMRARYVSDDDAMRCVVRVIPPSDVKLRYSSAGLPKTSKSWEMVENPNAIGCLETASITDVGGG